MKQSENNLSQLRNYKTHLLPWVKPLAHHSSRVVTAQPRLEVLPAPAPSPQEPVGFFRFLVHCANALLVVEVGPFVAAATLEEVVDGHVHASAQ